MAALSTPPLHRKANSAPPSPVDLEDMEETKLERADTMGSLSRSSSFRKRSRRRNRRRSHRRKSKTPKGNRLNKTNRQYRFKNGVERKLGPREIGRNSYKQGTKHDYEAEYIGRHWLDEKLHRHARRSSFLTRKAANPVQRKQGVEETGKPLNWTIPDYYQEEVQKMYSYNHAKRTGWGGYDSLDFLAEKPSKPKDGELEKLKDEKIPKGQAVKSYGSPMGWKGIEFEYDPSKYGSFLKEKFWFESSHVNMSDFSGLSRLIDALPPQSKMELDKVAAPTGYQSKINFLKQLRDIVMIEVKRIHKEDEMLKEMERNHKQKSKNNVNENNENNDKNENKTEDIPEVMNDIKDPHDIDRLAKEISEDFEEQLDIALDEILESEDDQFDNDNGKKKNNMSDNTKYKMMLARQTSHLGLSQRKVLTMGTVNKLSNMIDDMVHKQHLNNGL